MPKARLVPSTFRTHSDFDLQVAVLRDLSRRMLKFLIPLRWGSRWRY